MLRMSAAGVTHEGRVRTTNQDSVLVTDRFVAVADGLGGHAAGDVASHIAVDRLLDLDHLPDPTPDDLAAAVVDANRLILRHAANHPGRAGMGTTVAGVGLIHTQDAQACVVVNVGDSRVYRYADGELGQVSVDHSEVQELQDAGQLSAADALHYPRRNVITRCLGSQPAPAVDLWTLPAVAGDRYLVCSDGLTNEVDDAAIADVLASESEPGAAADELLRCALDAGGRDNVSVIVVAIEPVAEPA